RILVVRIGDRGEPGNRVGRDAEVVEQIPVVVTARRARDASLADASVVDDRGDLGLCPGPTGEGLQVLGHEDVPGLGLTGVTRRGRRAGLEVLLGWGAVVDEVDLPGRTCRKPGEDGGPGGARVHLGR